jgi:DNA-binding NarL/FixJ family response regulator
MRILIVDDNDRVRRGVVAMVSAETGWKVCGEANNGADAIRKARELLPDLLLVDISMPDLSGLEVARLLRQELPQIKILVMSHHDPAQLLPRALEAGANACLDKAYLHRDLLTIVGRMGEFQ